MKETRYCKDILFTCRNDIPLNRV